MNSLAPEIIEAKQEECFQKFLSSETNKILISQIPSGDSPENLKALLRAAFNAGHGNGIATVMVSLLESMMKERPAK